MKNLLPVAALFFLALQTLFAQNPGFNLTVEEEPFPGFPALQSFVTGSHDGKWVFLGGRTDGLHRRQPFAAFDPDGNNTLLYVADVESKQVWSKPLTGLPQHLLEQLQSTNMQFQQRDTVLYITGGYGYSPSADEWITHPYLTAVNLPGLIKAITAGGNIAPYFRSIMDNRVRVTGGYLGRLGDDFYLAGGQNFEGRYNPMGPTHGPGFFQEYTNAIKKFRIDDDGAFLAITGYKEAVDGANLHRRDYNMVAQIFPGGRQGFTLFSGVFQYDQDLPWLNTVDVDSSGYAVNNDFNQFLNQYHTAHAGLFSVSQNRMFTVFFGGISRYFIDANGVLKDDPEVPFVKTISLVTRFADGSMQEYKLGEMPGLLGSSAEFLPAENAPVFDHEVLDFDEMPGGKVLLGYIAGGIESTLPNIFFINDGDQSHASGKVFKVFLEKQTTAALEITGEQYFGLYLHPNPATGKLTVNFSVPVDDSIHLSVIDNAGRVVRQETRQVEFGEYELYYDLGAFAAGTYFLEIRNRKFQALKPFVKN
jgi:hypothetical protein